MPTETRLPKFIQETPQTKYEVQDLTSYPWGYDANEEILYVGAVTGDLYDADKVDHYNVDFPYSHFGFEDHEVDGTVEVIAEKVKFVTDSTEVAEDDENYDEDQGFIRQGKYIILLNPGSKQFHHWR
ncbi:hypothetical protein [Solirubrum puertoriconensis]|uniref:Uncharacterized protein n=1 Tax=Solirubrum puertoriconensis TaxID=1751427 RepID=A0A9X0HK73_SOLP1|nr:hypothetical protein [Solirubrum puertoriconensis]KUG07437.1 hypothetical protein ASU33_13875 [Solirubrum puertoriconensis]